MMQDKPSTTLHHSTPNIYLGYLDSEHTDELQLEDSYIGGHPIWLHFPSAQQLNCDHCPKQVLTFIGQIYCPLNAQHCYHRILYLLYCRKCRRCFKCIRQQATQSSELYSNKDKHCRILTEKAKAIDSEEETQKQVIRLMQKAKTQIEDEQVIDEEDEDEEDIEVDPQVQAIMLKQEEEIMEKTEDNPASLKDLRDLKDLPQMPKDNTDMAFEVYKRTMAELRFPVVLYGSTPVPYNSQALNPKHWCSCKNKLSLELQVTSQLLEFDKSLFELDWGSIMIYTCSGSCQGNKNKQGQEECVVVQYELDAISEGDIAKLKKKKKTDRKKKSKDNKHMQQKEKQKEKETQPKDKDNDWD